MYGLTGIRARWCRASTLGVDERLDHEGNVLIRSGQPGSRASHLRKAKGRRGGGSVAALLRQSGA